MVTTLREQQKIFFWFDRKIWSDHPISSISMCVFLCHCLTQGPDIAFADTTAATALSLRTAAFSLNDSVLIDRCRWESPSGLYRILQVEINHTYDQLYGPNANIT